MTRSQADGSARRPRGTGHERTQKAPKYTLETSFGSVRARNKPEDFETMIDEAMEEHADELLTNSG